MPPLLTSKELNLFHMILKSNPLTININLLANKQN